MEQDKLQKQEACTTLLSLLKTFQETLNDQRTQFFLTSVLTAVLSNHVSWMTSTGHPRLVKGGKGKEYDLHCPRRHVHHHQLNKQLKGIHGTNGKMAKVNSFVLLGSDTKTLRDLMYLITYFTRATAGVSTVHINGNEGEEGEGGGGDEILGRGRGPNGFVDHNNDDNPEEKEKEKGGEQEEDRGREDSAEGTDEESAQLTNEDFATSNNNNTTATATSTPTHSAEGESQPPALPAENETLPNHYHEPLPRQNPEGDGAEYFHRSPNHLSTSSLASLSGSPTSPPSPSFSRSATVPARSNVVQLDMLPLRYRPSSKCCHSYSFLPVVVLK